MNNTEYAHIMEEQDINNARQQEEEYALQLIDITTIDLPTSETFANNLINKILDGDMSPIEFAVKKKLIENALEAVLKNEGVKNFAIEEINKYGKEGVTSLGAKVTVVNRASYKYENDSNWKTIKDQMKPLEADLKAQEDLIKIACKTNSSLIDEKTGEVKAFVVPAPSTSSITVSFKK